jgi:hypothetical protein
MFKSEKARKASLENLKQARLNQRPAGFPRCGNCARFNESGKRTCFFGYHHPMESPCSSWEMVGQPGVHFVVQPLYDWKE